MIKNKNIMTEVLSVQPHNGERRSCPVTGQHLRLAMVAAGVEYHKVPAIAEGAGLYDSDITQAFSHLVDKGLLQLGPDCQDQLTPAGEAFVFEDTGAMLAARQLIAWFEIAS